LVGIFPHEIDFVREASATVTAFFSPFEVRFDRVMSFRNTRAKRPFVLRDGGDNTALLRFHRCLENALHVQSPLNPHVTLLYDEKNVAEERVNPIRWTVDELVLVHSYVGEGRYEMLGKWGLHGPHGSSDAA
jgi:2'-5' RNA ligase